MDTDYEREIGRLIYHIEAWVTASIPETEENIALVLDVLGEVFKIIRPNAYIITGEAMAKWFPQARDSEPDVKVTIKNIQLQHRLGDILLATYEEWKQIGDEAPSGVLSSVLLREKIGTPNNLEWLHIHEAQLPAPE
jgi:hypothetical protein